MFRGFLRLSLMGIILILGLQTAPRMIEAVRESYKIKPYKMDNLAEGLNLLRRFTPAQLSMEQRCERYAILLQDFRSSTQFTIAELGINPVRAGYKLRVGVETLRDLYIQAIDELKQGHIDQSLLDLIECLRAKYWAVDSKARSFLNQNDIKTLVEQYKSVIEQPMVILVDPKARHPELEGQQLHPALKRTLTDLYNGDAGKVELHFPTTTVANDDDDEDDYVEPPTEAPEPMPATPRPRAEAVAMVGTGLGADTGSSADSYADTGANNGYANRAAARAETDGRNAAAVAQTNAGGAMASGMTNTDGNRATAQAHTDGHNAAALADAESDGHQMGSASALANTYVNYGAATADAAAAAAAAAANTNTDAPADSNDQVPYDEEPEELSPEEREFLKDLRTNLVAVFDGLPENAEHPDRCLAYSQITSGAEEDLKQPNRVEQIVGEITAKISSQPQAPVVGQEEEQAFVPEKEVRDSFLVVLDAYKPEDLGEELWVDVLDCVAVWQEVDPDIKVYLQNHPHLEALAPSN